MTYIEELGMKSLDEFVAKAEEMGLSYGGGGNDLGFGFGEDMERNVQKMVIQIVKDYIYTYKEEDR